ncbi:hypothetical protein BDZ89DRAFT_373631 [Hymenopellis radicata]|nr:hypothetical protein BDZ89DRAFT_373631 [Hymenopellis radicata]
MAPLSLADPTVDNTVGAVFLGMLGACALFGVTSVQAYMYFHNYPKDSHWNKISVAVLWILDTLHLTLTIHAMYTYIVDESHTQIIHIVWSMKLQVVVMVIIIVLVQSLYAVRIWLLSGYHRGFLRYLVPVAVAGGFAVGIVFAYQIYQQATFEDLTSIAWALDSSLAAATVIDFFLALCMCYYLRKSRTSERQLNSRISVVMQYSLSSGLLTSTCSLSALFTGELPAAVRNVDYFLLYPELSE